MSSNKGRRIKSYTPIINRHSSNTPLLAAGFFIYWPFSSSKISAGGHQPSPQAARRNLPGVQANCVLATPWSMEAYESAHVQDFRTKLNTRFQNYSFVEEAENQQQLVTQQTRVANQLNSVIDRFRTFYYLQDLTAYPHLEAESAPIAAQRGYLT